MKIRLTLLCLLSSIALWGSPKAKIDTIYYDKEWKGVEIKEFASYYRILVKSTNPNYANRFRDYNMDGSLHCEGQYISIDRYDDEKSKFNGTIIYYYPNGNIKAKTPYKNGILDGEGSQFYENGKMQLHGYFDNGLVNGEWTKYDEEGRTVEKTTFLKGQQHGLEEVYENGQLKVRRYIVNGRMEGEAKIFHPNGNLFYTANFKNGVIDGYELIYDEDGNLREKTQYLHGLKVGDKEVRHNGKIEIIRYETIATSEGGLQFSFVINKKNVGSQKLLCIEINCYNPTNKNMNVSIDKISLVGVGVDNKGQNLKTVNLAYSSDVAMKMEKAVVERELRTAYFDAQNTARTASTYSTSSTTKGQTKSNSYGGAYVGSYPFSLSSGIYANGGNYSKSNTTVNNNEVVKDGYLEYQIRQSEMEKVQQMEQALNDQLKQLAEQFSYTNFEIPAETNVSKLIYAKRGVYENNKFVSQLTKLVLTFSINGTTYTKEYSPASSYIYSIK